MPASESRASVGDRRRWVVPAMGLVLVLAVVGSALFAWPNSGRRLGGPLTTGSDEVGQGLAGPARSGVPRTFSDVVLYNLSDEPAVLEGVELVDPSAGLRVVGLLAAHDAGRRTYAGFERF